MLELHKHHVLAQLQEQRLLKVTQDTAEGDKREVDGSLPSTQEWFVGLILHSPKNKPTKIYLPNVFEHVEHLRREMGGGHVKLCEVGF